MRFCLTTLLLLLFVSPSLCSGELFAKKLISKTLFRTLDKVLNFVDGHFNKINFDGLLGIVLAEAQLQQASTENPRFEGVLKFLINKCEQIRQKVESRLPLKSFRYRLFSNFLLNPTRWINKIRFINGKLKDYGIYKWSVSDILRHKEAKYKGVVTDFCLEEILRAANHCPISLLCEEMMLANRNDTSYLLSHRLFYLQIARLKGCAYDEEIFKEYTKQFCSLMLKEAKTNEHLKFPQHDLFLEQVLFCGNEGFEEFLDNKWIVEILSWLTPQGCFRPDNLPVAHIDRRSANIVEFGCTDHATGIGAAVLALNLRFTISANDQII